MTDVAAYLGRLGIDVPPPPTLDALCQLHRRHLERVPYENLVTLLGRPPSVDAADSLHRIGLVGRAGYCFHQNGAAELALRELGFTVSRRHGHVWTDESTRSDPTLNHLALVVPDLSTRTNPGGEWWFDVGLGDGFREPLPLVAGEYRQDGFVYQLEDVGPDGWTFRHDPTGSFGGVEVTARSTDPIEVLTAHSELAEPGAGRFARLLVVQRRYAGGVAMLRGCVLQQVTSRGTTETVLDTWPPWRAALDDLGVLVGDLDEAELRALFERSWTGHLAWDEAGRP